MCFETGKFWRLLRPPQMDVTSFGVWSSPRREISCAPLTKSYASNSSCNYLRISHFVVHCKFASILIINIVIISCYIEKFETSANFSLPDMFYFLRSSELNVEKLEYLFKSESFRSCCGFCLEQNVQRFKTIELLLGWCDWKAFLLLFT